MAFFINDECISCGACEPECPNGAISEGETVYVISTERCTECVGAYPSSQCAEVCPVDACQPDSNKPESKEDLLKKWQGLHPGENPVPGSY